MRNRFLKIFLNPLIWLGLILILAFVVRLYKIDNPIADWHSWRQADTAAVARDFYENGFNPLVPKYEDMDSVAEHPMPNVGRYRFVEFPIYNSLVYVGYLLNGGVSDTLARFITLIISLVSLIFVYLLTKRYFNNLAALCASFFFAVLPYNIYYSRVVLPDPLMVCFSLSSLYFTDRWIYEKKWWLGVIGVISAAAALLTKPMAIFLLLPLIYSVFRKEKRLLFNPVRYIIFAIIALAPVLWWREWIQQHPEGIPASNWLLNGNGIRFRPAFWRWIIGDRLDQEIMTAPGWAIFIVGIVKKTTEKHNIFLYLLLLSSFLYVCIFATGNVQHDYYQILIIPALCIFLGRGLSILLEGMPGFISRFLLIPIAIVLLGLMLYLGWYRVSGLFQINNYSIVTAGREADKILPKNALVIAPYQGDTAFLYQTNRNGFAVLPEPIPDMIKQFGVTDYISVNMDDQTNWIIRHYKVLEQNKDFVIIDLTHTNPSADYVNDPEPNHQ